MAYIFGAGSLTGRATIIVNGEENSTAWDTEASNAINIYAKDISATLKDANDVSIVLNNNMFTALQQIVVTTNKVPTKISASNVNVVYNNNAKLVVTLKDEFGNPIEGAEVTVVLNGATKNIKTNDKGQATYAISSTLVPKTYAAEISFAGDDNYVKSASSAKVVMKKATPKLTAKAKTFKVKTKTKKYTVILKTNKGKVLSKA